MNITAASNQVLTHTAIGLELAALTLGHIRSDKAETQALRHRPATSK